MYLQHLQINNLVLIEAATISFSENVTIISGETGVGKTVFTKAFDLLAGEKGDKSLLRPGSTESYVEAQWVLTADEQKTWQRIVGELDEIGEIVTVGRRMSATRSVGLVNGRACKLDVLAQLGNHSILRYGQHQQNQIAQTEGIRAILDGGFGTEQTYQTTKEQERHCAQLERSLATMHAQLEAGLREKDLLLFELEQLETLAPTPGEVDELLGKLTQAEAAAQYAESRHTLENVLEQMQQQLVSLPAIGDDISLNTLLEEIQSIQQQLAQSESGIDIAQMEQMNNRLSSLYDAARRHRVQPDELHTILVDKRTAIGDIDTLQHAVTTEEERLRDEQQKRETLQAQLHKQRHAAAPKWLKKVSKKLPEVALKDAKLQVEFLATDATETLQLMMQPGPGMQWGEVGQTASGGERSRLMLLLLHGGIEQRVLLLDEPDTGIGGETAHGIARHIWSLGQEQQVIVISHLPQIAIQADRQYVMDKQSTKQNTLATLYEVTNEQRIDELCRMSGYKPDDTAGRQAVVDLLVTRSQVPAIAHISSAAVDQVSAVPQP